MTVRRVDDEGGASGPEPDRTVGSQGVSHRETQHPQKVPPQRDRVRGPVCCTAKYPEHFSEIAQLFENRKQRIRAECVGSGIRQSLQRLKAWGKKALVRWEGACWYGWITFVSCNLAGHTNDFGWIAAVIFIL
ncbi:hypothetical protein [Azospirillum humicireducens]|uniref:hypothetical protein n=1 Tax=Azospirillum humicireducens TaxID=1226968 RepID=UPI000AD61A8C|nr:hypothetical protein [Azospirillum humicireducens]